MAVSIVSYFERLEQALISNNAVASYVVIQHEVTPADGKIRVRARLRGGGLLEFFEYVACDVKGNVVRLKYSYHWQDVNGVLMWRWDNVNHRRDLPHAPHHVHLPDGSVEGVVGPPDIGRLLVEIEATLRHESAL